MLNKIKEEAALAAKELLEAAELKRGDILVVGCSSSEIVGEKIGKGSSLETAEAVFDPWSGCASGSRGSGTALVLRTSPKGYQ